MRSKLISKVSKRSLTRKIILTLVAVLGNFSPLLGAGAAEERLASASALALQVANFILLGFGKAMRVIMH